MRGPSGGGTLWSGALQLLQSSPPESVARSQWPRAAHSGLMHCTVHPGKYCTLFPLWNDAPTFPVWSSGPDTHGKVAGILRRRTCGVKRKDTIPSGGVARRPTRRGTLWPVSGKISGEIVFLPLQPFGACPQSVLPIYETKGKDVFVCGKGCATR